jgi:hypothetical protein
LKTPLRGIKLQILIIEDPPFVFNHLKILSLDPAKQAAGSFNPEWPCPFPQDGSNDPAGNETRFRLHYAVRVMPDTNTSSYPVSGMDRESGRLKVRRDPMGSFGRRRGSLRGIQSLPAENRTVPKARTGTERVDAGSH